MPVTREFAQQKLPLEPSFLADAEYPIEASFVDAATAARGLWAACRTFGHDGVSRVVPGYEADLGGPVLVAFVTASWWRKPRELLGLPPVWMGFPVLPTREKRRQGEPV